MKASTHYQILKAFLGALLLSGFYMNCSKVNVSDLSSSEAVKLTNNEDGTFTVDAVVSAGQKDNSEVDLVWVIDNSGSMSLEISHVRSNLSQFAQTVGANSNLKMALISQAGTGERTFNLAITDSSRQMQINQQISSVNALLQLGAALCPNLQGGCSAFQNTATQGKLHDFFRPNSKKVFVIVSDDESVVTVDSFRGAFSQVYPGQNFSLFGFVGLGSTISPCQAKTGQRYIDLANQSQGKTYNICDANWGATFNSLAASVLTLIGPAPVQLSHALSDIEILKITLDGQPVPISKYNLTSAGIVLALDLFQANRIYQLKVTYRLKN